MSIIGPAAIRTRALWFKSINGIEYSLTYNQGTDQWEIWREGYLIARYIEKIRTWICEYNGQAFTMQWPSFSDVAKHLDFKCIMIQNPDSNTQEDTDYGWE